MKAPLPESERSLLKDVISAPWAATNQESRAVELAAKTLVPVLGVPVAATQLNGLDEGAAYGG